MASAFLDEHGAGPGEILQLPEGLRRDERGPDHGAFGELGQPDRVQHVGLRAPGDVLHIARVDEPAVQSAGLRQVEERAPVRARRFHDDPLDALADQPVTEFQDRIGGRGDVPDLLDAPAKIARLLTANELTVIEVDRPDRKARRDNVRSDPIDAYGAATAVLSARAGGTPRARNEIVEAIRALRVVRKSAVKARAQTINQIRTSSSPRRPRCGTGCGGCPRRSGSTPWPAPAPPANSTTPPAR